MAFNVEGWEGLEAPYASGARRPEGLPGMAGVRDDLQQLVEQRIPPPSWTTGGSTGLTTSGTEKFHLGFNPLMHIPVVSPDPIKRGRGGLRPGP